MTGSCGALDCETTARATRWWGGPRWWSEPSIEPPNGRRRSLGRTCACTRYFVRRLMRSTCALETSSWAVLRGQTFGTSAHQRSGRSRGEPFRRVGVRRRPGLPMSGRVRCTGNAISHQRADVRHNLDATIGAGRLPTERQSNTQPTKPIHGPLSAKSREMMRPEESSKTATTKSEKQSRAPTGRIHTVSPSLAQDGVL